MKHISLSLVISLLVFPALMYAGMTGKISGRVVDAQSGEPLAGCNIIVEGTSLGAAADQDGYYRILNLSPGIYSVRASMIGYNPVIQKNVKVLIDLTTPLDFNMGIGSIQGQVVIVQARQETVKMDVTSTSFHIDSDQIVQLQVDNLSDIVELQAGVVQGHFRGGRAGEVMYIVDGIPMNDSYSGDNLFDVESDMIQEVDVISGTFNAEYGQAMSGIVNIVTKEGQKTFSGKLSLYGGDYFSSHSDIFLNINDANISAIHSYQFKLSGPIPFLKNRLTFSVIGRKSQDSGWMYGKRIFQTGDFSYFTDDTTRQIFQATGDQSYVPMNPNSNSTLQGKLSFKLTDRDKLNYTGFYNKRYNRDFDRLFKYNPDGNYNHYANSYQNALQYTRMFGTKTFMNVNLSSGFTDYSQYVFKDPDDPRYVPIEYLNANNSNGFSTGGARMWHHYRNNKTDIVKFDLRSQFEKVHTLGLGASYKHVHLWLHEYQLYFDENNQIRTPASTSAYNNRYVHDPEEIAFYLQDKMELGEMIVNAGLRYDFFNPDGVVPENFYNTVGAPKRKAATSDHWSPRFGIAYPISDQGVIHFSYGHFFQVPNYEYLYINPDFEVALIHGAGADPPRGRFNSMGNAELKPEKTVSYEIGLKQAILENLTIDITGYNKDIRDLIGQITLIDIYGGKFWHFINRDYANVRGITVALELTPAPGQIGFSLDYTYQVATGNASDPLDESKNQETNPPIQSEKKRQPLNWDQTHSLNLTATLNHSGYLFSLISQLGSGTPYTRESPFFNNRILNGERKPVTFTVDFNASKNFMLGSIMVSPFLKISNLFDRKNNLEVYPSSGSADFDYNIIYENYRGYSTLEDWLRQPNYYDTPRKILVGCSFTFNQKD
ncbi:MAG: TonB-dependent receptor [Candidatus Marinimicrobia bacterium]|nr:TonB-dependent receptor [Candidatus Neomarinimicrobiota bacterium]MCF7841175.1 TonB-dependent receptor [Candidatus Neomarinimicrobiota bacterium]